MIDFKFSKESNEKAMKKWGITVDEAARAFAEDPQNEEKRMWFYRAIDAASEQEQLHGKYILKPDTIIKLNELLKYYKRLIKYDQIMWDDDIGFSYVPDYRRDCVSLICKSIALNISSEPHDREIWDNIMSLCNCVGFRASQNKNPLLIIEFEIKDAFIHIDD